MLRRMRNILRTKENISNKTQVFVGLSGGVDSAVSAALLKEAGYDVTGVFIRIALPGYPCSAGSDKISAMRVAAHLHIPFREIDLSKEYEKEVFRTSVREFARGRTPNPDVLCNRDIKFGAFYNYAREQGADFIATGHYAKVACERHPRKPLSKIVWPSLADRAIVGELGEPRTFLKEVFSDAACLRVSADTEKDQSYFLWMVPEEVLRHVIFPVGDLHKKDVRELANKFGLPNAARPDSQGLCFLGDIAIEDMLERELSPQQGDIISENGNVIGRHDGAVLYTLGQRHGFTLFSQTPDTQPHFVIGKNVEQNTVTVSVDRYPTGAKQTKISLTDVNLLGEVEPGKCQARYRYRQTLIDAELSIHGETAVVVLHEPQYVPIGQSLVLYRGDRCLGGGIVDTATLI